MKKFSFLEIISIGFAIFSMFFGAGNLILPLQTGMISGSNWPLGVAGFIITGVFLPFIALIAIILFDGDHHAFFKKIGKPFDSIFILFCMLIIGPLYAIPRIVTFSHIMISPFLGNISLPLFAAIFLSITFLGCYKENRILDLLGKIVSPLLIVSLTIILIKGIIQAGEVVPGTIHSPAMLLWENIKIGYSTLDIIGAIFFSAIVINILKQTARSNGETLSSKALIRICTQAGAIGLSLLAAVYVGMAFLGAYYGGNFGTLNAGELFSAISFAILGQHGAIIIAIAVLMACYSTVVPLCAVFSEYLNDASNKQIAYIPALLICITVTGVISTLGLTNLMNWFKPIIEILYPSLISFTIANLAYKLVGFTYVRAVTLGTLALSIVLAFF